MAGDRGRLGDRRRRARRGRLAIPPCSMHRLGVGRAAPSCSFGPVVDQCARCPRPAPSEASCAAACDGRMVARRRRACRRPASPDPEIRTANASCDRLIASKIADRAAGFPIRTRASTAPR
jgi:hypothetical protein